MKMKVPLLCIQIVMLIMSSGSIKAGQTEKETADSSLIPPANLFNATADTTSLDSLDSTSADTTLFTPTLQRTIANAVTNPVNFEEHLSQKPTVALFKSLIVPGWGQIGNRRYVKAAIVIGLDSWFVSRAVHFGRQASTARRKWQAASLDQNKIGLYNDFDDKRGTRNKFIWFSGIVTFLSIFDAYVDAHLSGEPGNSRNDAFQVSIVPEQDGGAMLAVQLRF